MKPSSLDPILVVDDDEDDLLTFQRAAARAHLANPIVCLNNGEEVVRYFSSAAAENRPAPVVIILDLKMPRMNGFEVLDWLRRQPGLRRIPVIVFTSSSQDPDIARAYEAGANSYLVKPVSFDRMIELLASIGLYWLVFNEKPDVSTGSTR